MSSPTVRPGTVYWLTGLSGAGKTTVARLLQEGMRARNLNPVLLDGDVLREIFGARHGYTREDRLSLAHMYGRLCREIAHQGVDVICATISMFHEVRDWNRAHIERYIEVYLRVPHTERARRDSKGYYAAARAGALNELAGVDQHFEEPQAPHLLIDNHGDLSPDEVARMILKYTPETSE